MAFRIEAFQNRHLAPGQTRVDAILTIAADPAIDAASELWVGFIVDKSGSMAHGRLDAVQHATVKAIQALAEGTWFFVVAFDGNAYVIVEATRASAESKRSAASRIAEITAAGGTAMSSGLCAARAIFARAPDAIRRAVFLTDGKNEGEKPAAVAEELRRCEGVFECDCWGVGTDWQVGEVQTIARALLGRAALIPSPDGVEAAFRGAVERAGKKALRDVRLRLWTPMGATVIFVKQVSPTIEDLTARPRRIAPQVLEYPTGSWGGGEARDFHVAVDVRAGKVGDEVLACRPTLVYARATKEGWAEVEEKAHDARVRAVWTADEALASRLDHHVAHYAGQDELAAAIERGLSLRDQGMEAEASHQLGRAVRLAHASKHAVMTQRLARVVEVVDPERGTVRLRRDVKKAVTMDLELESRTTQRVPRRPTGAT